MKKLSFLVFLLMFGALLSAQTTVTGKITDNNGLPIPGANVKVVGKSLGTTSDFDGKFNLSANIEVPFLVEFSLIGFESKTVNVLKNNQIVNVTLNEGQTILDEVVVSASRTPERIMESPVTIERMDLKTIKGTASPSFYDGLENLKGVDFNTNSLTFKSVNTRGFATFSNTRFVQLVDGMDNSSPALNFVIGNLLGTSELDIYSIELLPGASSALYGANAFNGILFMNSKNPFDFPGVSAYGKTGITSQKAAGDNDFVDAGIRFAYKFSNRFAAKTSFSFMKGTDWYAVDYRDLRNSTYTRATPNYDGLNVYGDEVVTTLNFDQLGGLPAGTLGSAAVSRTGYNESDMMDYNAETTKFDVSLHYRPFENDLEVIFNGKVGLGQTIYQGANRYSIKDFYLQQYKLEIKNNDFYIRGYITSESAGNSYDTRFAAINLNRMWKSDTQWFTQYATTFIGARLGALPGGPQSATQAHATARSVADTGRLIPGTAAFSNGLANITSDPDLLTGAKFVDGSKIYNIEGNYNFNKLIDFAEIQLGGSIRNYSLNSEGTIFTDYDGPIEFKEYGAYMQVQKKLANDRLKLTGSIRYDKNELMEGNYSPRASISYAAGESKNHNFRASFQTGFKNPTTQDLYIGLDIGQAILVGSSKDNLDRYTSRPLNVSTTGRMFGNPATVTLSGRAAYENSFTLTSVLNGTYQKATVNYVKPEEVFAYEVGYRAALRGIAFDLNAYMNKYNDFIATKTVVVPYYGKVDLTDTYQTGATTFTPRALVALSQNDWRAFQVYTNSTSTVKSYGGSVGVSTNVFNNFEFGVNYTYAKLDFDQSKEPDFEAGFNTPEHKVKVSLGKAELFKNFGFNVNVRWNDSYLWQATFADGVLPATTVVDAQVNLTVPSWKSVFKIGGANLGGKEYQSAIGTGYVGSQFFASWTINP